MRDAERAEAADAVVKRADIRIGGIGFGGVERERVKTGLGGERDAEIQHDFLAGRERRNRETQLRVTRGEEQVAHAVVQLQPDRRQRDGRVGAEKHAHRGTVQQLEIPRRGSVAVENGGGDEFEFAVAVAGFSGGQNVGGEQRGAQIGRNRGVVARGDRALGRGRRGLMEIEVAAHALFGCAVVDEVALRKQ